MHNLLHTLKNRISHKQTLCAVLVAVIVLSGTTAAAYHGKRGNSPKKSHVPAAVISNSPKPTETKPDNSQSATSPAANTSTPAATPSPAPAKTPTPVVTRIPDVAPKPAVIPVNTTNCLPPNPSVYATYFIGMTNSAYLTTNNYSKTTKMYAALQFAGLLSAADAKQVVVFAPNDYTFDTKLTATQQAWMNQSPENMKSVIGWHIITGCVTYNGVNPIKDLNGSIILNTLNGPVTYSSTSHGKVENAEIAIWDWFTSNGAVTFITDFIKPPAIQ